MECTVRRSGGTYVVEGGCVDAWFIVKGVIDNNIYLVDDGDGGVVVFDPGEDARAIVEAAQGKPVSAIVVTHGHYDHTGALAELKRITGAPVHACRAEVGRITDPVPSEHGGVLVEACAVDRAIDDGDEVRIGALSFSAIHTPGHTPGSMCFLVEGDGGAHEGLPMLFSGDTLFEGATGRTDFAGGSIEQMCRSMARLGQLDDATVVLPGHNNLTTIGTERPRVIAPLAARANR